MLQLGIESGVNAKALRFQIGFGEILEEVVFDHVHEVGRGAAIHAAIDEVEFRFFGSVGLFLGDVTIFDHLRQQAVARFFGTIEVALGGGVAIGGANDSGKKSAFAQGELADILAEIGFGGLAEAANGKTAAVAEIDFVGV